MKDSISSQLRYYYKNREKILKKQRESKYHKKYMKKWNREHREYHTIYLKEWRHRKGISKKYNSEVIISKRQQNQIYKRRVRMGGKLPIKRLQRVYEDNIKQYETLTCYLCLKSILFGKDCLEHKIPLSRGGTNEYKNLAIAHRSCNSKKHNKTEKEYRKEIL